MKGIFNILVLSFCACLYSNVTLAQEGGDFRINANQIALAWNTQDTTLLKSLYAEQFNRTQSWDTTTNRIDLVKSYLNTTAIIKNSTITLSINESVVTTDQIIVPFTISGISDIKFCEESVPDEPIQYHGIQILTFRENLVVTEKLFYDRLPLLNNVCTNIFNKSGPVVIEDPD